MQIISVVKQERLVDTARPSVTIEAVIADSGTIFQVDFVAVCALLKGLVPFRRARDVHALAGSIMPSEIPTLLLDAARIGANLVEVGRDVHMSYLIGIVGIGTAWNMESGTRKHLWHAEDSTLCGPVPRDEKNGRSLPVVLTIIVQSLSDHSDAPFLMVLRPLVARAGNRIERALKKDL